MNNTELHKSLDAVEQVFLTKATKDRKEAKQAIIKQLDALIIKAEVDMLEKHFVTPQFISKPTKKIKEVAGGVKRVGQALGTAAKEAYKKPAPLSDYSGVREHLPGAKKESYGEYLKTKTQPQTTVKPAITKPKFIKPVTKPVVVSTRVAAVSPPKETKIEAITKIPTKAPTDTRIAQEPVKVKVPVTKPAVETTGISVKPSEETAKLIGQTQKKKLTV